MSVWSGKPSQGNEEAGSVIQLKTVRADPCVGNTLPNRTCKQQYLAYTLDIAVFSYSHVPTRKKYCTINASDWGLVPVPYQRVFSFQLC